MTAPVDAGLTPADPLSDDDLTEVAQLYAGERPALLAREVRSLRERVAELEEEREDWRRRAEAAEYALAPYLDEHGHCK